MDKEKIKTKIIRAKNLLLDPIEQRWDRDDLELFMKFSIKELDEILEYLDKEDDEG